MLYYTVRVCPDCVERKADHSKMNGWRVEYREIDSLTLPTACACHAELCGCCSLCRLVPENLGPAGAIGVTFDFKESNNPDAVPSHSLTVCGNCVLMLNNFVVSQQAMIHAIAYKVSPRIMAPVSKLIVPKRN